MLEVAKHRADFEIYEMFGSAIEAISGRRLRVKVDDVLDGHKVIEITMKDVIEYYATQANNISSGMRVIGTLGGNRGIAGDWRQIDAIANACLESFKILNIEGLRRDAAKQGLTPRF